MKVGWGRDGGYKQFSQDGDQNVHVVEEAGGESEGEEEEEGGVQKSSELIQKVFFTMRKHA